MAQQVSNGTTYAGKYFVLANNIDLNGQTWTPIGKYNRPFQGIFDGTGHTITNAIISLPSTSPTSIESYGLFGALGSGNTYAKIKNLQIDNIRIEINYSGNTDNNTTAKGYNIGIVTGTMFNKSEVKNVIVTNSTIMDNYTLTFRTYATQVFIGGIAGYAVNSRTSQTDPGSGNRYSIENCYSNTNIDVSMKPYRTNNMQTVAQFGIGGIIGGIKSQPVWPVNCYYKGTINSTYAMIGPIFGYLRNNTLYTSTSNYPTLWNGNDAGNLTCSSYYTNYSVNKTTYTNTVTSGTSNAHGNGSTRDMKNYQGVNKGSYLNNFNTMLNNFNNYVTNHTEDTYWTWHYDGSEYYFETDFTDAKATQNGLKYVVSVTDNAHIGNLNYKWYLNGTLNPDITGNEITESWTDEYNADVLIGNGRSYIVVSFVVPKLEVHVTFVYNESTKILTANLQGSGTEDPNFNISDYTYKWYQQDIAESDQEIIGATTNTLSNLENAMDYKVVATNTNYSYMSTEGIYSFGERTVIYVNEDDGSDNNDGATPETAVKTMTSAYSKFDSTKSRNENVIVLIADYTNTDLFNTQNGTTFKKNVTITGKYKGTDYSPELSFEGYNNGYKYLNGDTTLMHLTFNGQTTRSWFGKSNSQVYFYLQGYSLTMGEGLHLTGYSTSNTNQGLLSSRAPAFHIIAGWLKYNYATLPRNNPEILIKSGSYGRIILGGSPGTTGASNLQNYVSHNFTGSSDEDKFNITVTVDIKNSTKPSNYDYDINLLVGGSACGNTYAHVTENIIAGTVGRILGASIGDSSDFPSNWNYPINTFIGDTNINISGGTVEEIYGGCLGRNMNAIGGYSYGNYRVCDSYFYGTININITGGNRTKTIYGAGARRSNRVG